MLESLEKSKTFLNKDSKHKKIFMECLNSENKNNNIKGSGSPYASLILITAFLSARWLLQTRILVPNFIYG